MPMPTHINGRPVKTGSWTPEEDDLLAEWQAKVGNRSAQPLCFDHSFPAVEEQGVQHALQRH